jgi:hypothetical protein
MTQMTIYSKNSASSMGGFGGVGFGRVGAVCKQILNGLVEMAHRSEERSRFALLPRRYLDDVGMTIAERDAQVL